MTWSTKGKIFPKRPASEKLGLRVAKVVFGCFSSLTRPSRDDLFVFLLGFLRRPSPSPKRWVVHVERLGALSCETGIRYLVFTLCC